MTDPTNAPSPDPAQQSLPRTLDHVLRGTFLQQDRLASGRIDVPVRRLLHLGLVLGGVYGIALGSYAAFRGADQAFLQIVASCLKVPLLFLLTLVVTFPSLYVFAAIQRLPLGCASTLRLLLLAILVHLAVIASLAPVFAFFAASTKSYAFMILLNVAFFALGGVLGFVVLRRATHGLLLTPPAALGAGGDALAGPPASDAGVAAPSAAPFTPPAPPSPPRARPHALAPLSGEERARRVLRTWVLVYGAVGAQMGWLLRPFLGSPDIPFTWLRPREDNVFLGVVRALRTLFGG